MSRFAPVLLVAIGFAILAADQVSLPEPAAEPLVAAAAEKTARDEKRERVIELPEDGDLWQTIVVYDDAKKAGNAKWLAAEITTTPRLQSLVAQTQYYEYDPSHWWVKRNHAGDPTPMVMVQTDTGRVIYKAFGEQLPRDGEELADEIEQMIAQCCPDQNQPAKPGERVSKIPILRPATKTPAIESGWLQLAAIVLTALAAWFAKKPKPAA